MHAFFKQFGVIFVAFLNPPWNFFGSSLDHFWGSFLAFDNKWEVAMCLECAQGFGDVLKMFWERFKDVWGSNP